MGGPKIIGVTGYICAGKDTFLHELVKNHERKHFSFKDLILDEARIRRLGSDRTSLQNLARDVESAEGPYAWANKLIGKIKEDDKLARGSGLYVVETFRTVPQIDAFRQAFGGNFYLVGVIADFEVRFGRMLARGREGDPKNEGEFKVSDYRDQGHTPDSPQETERCVARSQYVFTNNYKTTKPFINDISRWMQGFK